MHHIAKLDGIQNIMGLYGEPIFETDLEEDAMISLGFLEDHSTELKNAREGLTYVNYDFRNNHWVTPDSIFVRFDDEKVDSSEIIEIAKTCIEWVKEQVQLNSQTTHSSDSSDERGC